MTNDDVLKRAKALLETARIAPKEVEPLHDATALLSSARKVLDRQGSLDVYVVFDTTGSMGSYIAAVRENLGQVTDALLDGKADYRLSMNGIGDHCDGENWAQMYALSSSPAEVRGALESIVMTFGGDEPEAYECGALLLAERLPKESAGRKRAVVLVADSVPHGMNDAPCERNVDYQRAFEALKTLCDGFYLIGCDPQTYKSQRRLIDSSRPEREQFIPLGDMTDVLPELLIALAKKTESAGALQEYLRKLTLEKPEGAKKVYGLLASGK